VLHTGDRDDVIEPRDDLLECYRGGVNSYITKPVNLSLFEETVKQIGKYWLGFNLPPPEAAFEKR